MAFENISLPLIILIGLLPGWFTAEDFWLKTQAAKSTKEAYKGWGMMFGSLLAIVIIPCVLIGLFGLIIFEPEVVNGVVNAHASLGIEGGYAVLSAYINQMHPVLKAVMIFMLAAHTMSTVANYTNVSAMNLSYDILQPTVYRKLKWSDEKIVNWSRGIMAVMIVVNVCVAELMTAPSLDNILNLAYQLSSGLLSSAIAIMMLSLWWKRANLEGVLTGGICGAIGTFSFFIFEYVIAQHSYTMPVWDWIFGQGAMANSYYGYCVIGVFCGVLGLLIGTYLNPPPTNKQLAAIADEPIDDNEVFFEGLKASS
jgi:SSS family solute:Na+ symporter